VLAWLSRLLHSEPAVPQPCMTRDETRRYDETLAAGGIVVEYGCGGSTLLALSKLGVKRVVSVETDPGWIDALRAQAAIQQAELSHRLQLIHVDIGPVGKWGYPLDKSQTAKFAVYPGAPWRVVDAADVVLVDGRFRVASAIASLKRAGPSTQIVIHDFWNRPSYHVILPLVDCIARVEKLAVFRRKAKFNDALADELAGQHASNDL